MAAAEDPGGQARHEHDPADQPAAGGEGRRAGGEGGRAMKGTMTQRSPGSWSLVFDLPPGPDGQRRQKRVTVKGGKREAQAELNRILAELQSGAFVEPAKLTVGEYLD